MSRGNAQISEEALMQDFCERLGLKLKSIYRALGARFVMDEPNRVWMNEWTPNRMNVVLNDPKKVGHKKFINRVRLENLYYDPQSIKKDGDPHISRGKAVPVPNGSKTIINPYADKPFMVDLSHTDKLASRKRTNINLSSTFTSTTEVEGSYGGVSLKQTIQLAIGAAVDKEKEETHETEDTASLPGIEIPANKAVLQTVTKESVTVVTPFNMKSYPDFVKIIIDLEDGVGRDGRTSALKSLGGNREIAVEGFLGLQRLLNGGDWRERGMRSFKNKAGKQARDSMNWIADKHNRYVELEGEERDVFDDNLVIHPKFVNV